MPSQGVLNRERVGRQILAVLRFHAQEVGERLQTILAVMLEDGETLPDLDLLQVLLTRLVERHLGDLLEAAEAHQAEKDDDDKPRDRRLAACAALREQLTAIRDAVRVVFGPDAELTRQVLDGEVPQDPVALHRFATRMVECLRKPGSVTPRTDLFPDQSFDMGQAAESLDPQIESLGRALEQVGLERRELEWSLSRQDRSIEAFDRVARGVTHTLQGWCALVGRPKLAGSIRLTPLRRLAARRGKGA